MSPYYKLYYKFILYIKCYILYINWEKNEFSQFLQCGHSFFCWFACLFCCAFPLCNTWLGERVAAPSLQVKDLRQVMRLSSIHQRSTMCKTGTRAFGAKVEWDIDLALEKDTEEIKSKRQKQKTLWWDECQKTGKYKIVWKPRGDNLERYSRKSFLEETGWNLKAHR